MPVKEDPLQIAEVITMKLSAMSIAVVLAGIAGVASAAGQSKVLSPVYVSSVDIQACTPPADAPACAGFHRMIRANFTAREIGMLFGASTAYPEYLTGGIDRLQRRYHTMVQQYVASQQAAHGANIATR